MQLANMAVHRLPAAVDVWHATDMLGRLAVWWPFAWQ